MMRKYAGYASVSILLVVLLASSGCAPRQISRPAPSPPDRDTLGSDTGTWVEEQLSQMTLEQQVSQMFSAPAFGRYTSTDDPAYQRLIDLVEHFEIGGIIFFQGEPLNQAVMANALQDHAKVPLLVSQDMEWGSGMRVEHATTFPRTMAMGATRDPQLAYAAGFITAREARALGVRHVFAPVADVNNNPLNPIINVRSFSERPDLVATMVRAFVDGVQDQNVIATLKHFPGHGDTAIDSHTDLPVLHFSRARLDTLELIPFRAAIRDSVKSIMTGHLALPLVEPDSTVPASLSARVTTDMLRDEFGFQGLIVTDALDMRGVTKNFTTGEIAVRAVKAGADMLLMSEDPYAARAAILEAIAAGQITEERIRSSVLRILRAKEWLGLHRDKVVNIEAVRQNVGTDIHLSMSEHIARESLTLLRNHKNLLPITGSPRRIFNLVISDSDDPNVSRYFETQLIENGFPHEITTRFVNRNSPREALHVFLNEVQLHDVVIIPTFVYVRAGAGRINLSEEQRNIINQVVAIGKQVVLIALGNPYVIMDLEQPDVFLTAYSASESSQKAVAQALFGRSGMHGRLPIAIPNNYPFGAGLDLEQVVPRLGYAEEVGMEGMKLGRIDTLIHAAIADHAFPGAALAIGRAGVIPRMKGFGYFTYQNGSEITPESLFDLASLTKVIATTTAAMKLYEEGRLDLDAPVSRYLPDFGQNGKAQVTIRHLLTHTSGLIPFRPFHREGFTTRQSIIDAIMAEPLHYDPGTESQYSDLGLITMALVIEQITGRNYAEYLHEEVFDPLSMVSTGFRKTGVSDPTVVPTEEDELFRHRLIQGEVHDEAAWILGGTAGHAGLFSTARDLSNFAYMLVNGGRFGGKQLLKEETIRLFTTPVDPEIHTRALGWDTRSKEGYSSSGQFFGPRSFGHTGFTGTSIWIDPDQKLFVILLTNRVYPTRENSKIVPLRAELADISYMAIEGPIRPLLLVELERMGLLPGTISSTNETDLLH